MKEKRLNTLNTKLYFVFGCAEVFVDLSITHRPVLGLTTFPGGQVFF